MPTKVCGVPTVRIDELVSRVRDAAPRLGPVRLVCVDGPSGSGKSTLAELLAERMGAQIVHMDDLYEGWSGLGKVWDRLEEWVLAPLRSGRPGRYRRYDWVRSEYAEWHDVPLAPVLVVEGVGSADLPIDSDATLKIWVEAPRELRFERGIARDGEAYLPYWEAWAAEEDRHFAAHRTRERADVLLDGSQPYD